MNRRKELMKISIDIFINNIIAKKAISRIEFDILDMNKSRIFKNHIIPKLRRCHHCESIIMYKEWIETFVLEDQHRYYHSGCFDTISKSFIIEG